MSVTYRIDAETAGFVRRIAGEHWESHTTTRELRFRTPGVVEGEFLVFALDGWELRVHRTAVIESRSLDGTPPPLNFRNPGGKKGRGRSRQLAHRTPNGKKAYKFAIERKQPKRKKKRRKKQSK